MDYMYSKSTRLLVEALDDKLCDEGFFATTNGELVKGEGYVDVLVHIENDEGNVVVTLFYRIDSDFRPQCIVLNGEEISHIDLDVIVQHVLSAV